MIFIASIFALIVCFYILTKIVDEHFLKSLDNISESLKLTPSVAGATLMAMGTSAPELSTSLFALFLPNANPAIGVGTIVGSAIFQMLVVIGFVGIVKTSFLRWKPVIRDGLFYSVSIVQLIIILSDRVITVFEASTFLITYVVYLVILFWWSRKYSAEEAFQPDPIEIVEDQLEFANIEKRFRRRIVYYVTFPIDFLLNLLPDCRENRKWTFPIFFISLTIIAAASYVLVIAAESLAGSLGIPSTIVALTILAGGSSIPELISSAIVAKEGRGDMAISNAIGSNVFDILISLGLPVFIYAIVKGDLQNVGGENISSSIWLLFVTLISVIVILISQKFKVGKVFGGILILIYILYVLAAYGGLL